MYIHRLMKCFKRLTIKKIYFSQKKIKESMWYHIKISLITILFDCFQHVQTVLYSIFSSRFTAKNILFIVVVELTYHKDFPALKLSDFRFNRDLLRIRTEETIFSILNSTSLYHDRFRILIWSFVHINILIFITNNLFRLNTRMKIIWMRNRHIIISNSSFPIDFIEFLKYNKYLCKICIYIFYFF